MTDKDLKRLSRAELLQLLIEQVEENQKLREALAHSRKKLEDRQLQIDKAGSLAEAALQVNGFFQAAEAAAQQYLENIQRQSEQHEEVGRRIQEQAQKKAAEIIKEADQYSRRVRAEAEAYRERIVDRTLQEWQEQTGL